MKILVTGGTGFVGKNLVPLLKHDVRIFSRKGGDAKGDLRNYRDVKKATKNTDVTVHLANSENYHENIGFMRNIIRAGKENKVKKIIFISSMAAKRSFPDEYGESKLKAEKMLKESGLNYTILRPSIIYGKGSRGFERIENLIKKIPFFTPIIGDGKYKIMPVHVKDVVESIEKCIKNKKTDRKEYDITGNGIYFIDLINFIKKEKNIKRINVHIPAKLLNVLSFLAPKIISRERIKNLTEDTKADTSKRKELNYEPIGFEDFKNFCF